jgi:hypothetical protein
MRVPDVSYQLSSVSKEGCRDSGQNAIFTGHSVYTERRGETGTIPAILVHGEYPQLEEVRLQVPG